MDLAQVYLYSRRDVSSAWQRMFDGKCKDFNLMKHVTGIPYKRKSKNAKCKKLHSNISTKRNMKHSRKKFKQKIQSLTQKMLQEIKKIPM